MLFRLVYAPVQARIRIATTNRHLLAVLRRASISYKEQTGYDSMNMFGLDNVACVLLECLAE